MTASLSPYEAKFVIECLRSGIASSAVSELFAHGQNRIVNAFQEELGRGSGALAIEGGYGQGKTHLLKHLAQLARRRGYVVSLVALSKETPFHHWWHLYGAAIAQAERPDAPTEPGLGGVLRRLKGDDPAIQQLRAGTEALHPRLTAVLDAYYATTDPELRYRLQSDLMGHALTNGEISRIYRTVTNQRVKLPAARLIQTGRDYFAFAAQLFRHAGYAGWVVLFDEFELVCKLSAQQRARAYANLQQFRVAEETLGGLLTVAAFIPGMVSDFLIGGTCDLSRLPETMRARGEEEIARNAEAGIRWLVEDKLSLVPLREEDSLEVLDRIATIHERAYGWRRSGRLAEERFYAPSPSVAERMRTKVRYCVEALDLAYLYGELPRLETDESAQPILTVDEEFFAGRLGEVTVEDVDR
jgi:hypothetical protein